MTITAKVIADSISADKIRLTTMELRYPRIIHAEFMTHRAFSRNASSSRAIPTKRLIDDVRRDMAMPSRWGSNKPGMQAGDDLDEFSRELVEREWRNEGMRVCDTAERLSKMPTPPHKQVINRMLEPWSHISVVVSATDWNNFFHLRDHPDADPTLHALAALMNEARNASTPTFLNAGSWHLPYITDADYDAAVDLVLSGTTPDHYGLGGTAIDLQMASLLLRKMSVARCARVSYLRHDGMTPTIDDDLRLFNTLMGMSPLHASPAEHQATPDKRRNAIAWTNPHLHGNFRGWNQYRRHFPNEAVSG